MIHSNSNGDMRLRRHVKIQRAVLNDLSTDDEVAAAMNLQSMYLVGVIANLQRLNSSCS